MKISITVFGRTSELVVAEKKPAPRAAAPAKQASEEMEKRLSDLESKVKREDEWKEWQANRGPSTPQVGFAPNPRAIEESWRIWEPL